LVQSESGHIAPDSVQHLAQRVAERLFEIIEWEQDLPMGVASLERAYEHGLDLANGLELPHFSNPSSKKRPVFSGHNILFLKKSFRFVGCPFGGDFNHG